MQVDFYFRLIFKTELITNLLKYRMNKAISFDLWQSLISGNPQFKLEKCELIRKFFNLDKSDREILDSFVRADKLLDKVQEKFLIQPELFFSWAIVLSEIGIEKSNPAEIESFLEIYNRLFLEFPPVLFDDVEWFFEKLRNDGTTDSYILSNTILVRSETLQKFINTTILKEVTAFYSDTHFPKPDCRAFEVFENKPFIHVGDNVYADGNCVNSGIEFYQIRTNGKTLKDFWQFINP